MGRRPQHFQDALRYLQWTWKAEAGLPEGLREYLAGLVDEAVELADKGRLGHFGRMLASDVLRLHRASVETAPDALTRCRLVGTQERALTKLGLQGTRGWMNSWTGPSRLVRPAQTGIKDGAA
jgi:hypothetical protein